MLALPVCLQLQRMRAWHRFHVEKGQRFRITTTVSHATAQIDLILVPCPAPHPQFMHFAAGPGQYTAPRGVVSRGALFVWRRYTYMHHTTTHDIFSCDIGIAGEIIRSGGLIIASRAANHVLLCLATERPNDLPGCHLRLNAPLLIPLPGCLLLSTLYIHK